MAEKGNIWRRMLLASSQPFARSTVWLTLCWPALRMGNGTSNPGLG